MTKQRIVIENWRCDFCGTCVCVCPEDAICLNEAVIQVEDDLCSLCRNCVVICPLGIPEVKSEEV